MKIFVKIISALLCIALVSAFAGCDKTQEPEATPTESRSVAETEASTEKASEETTEAEPEDLDIVVNAIYNVKAGSAGASLRAEEAGKALAGYAKKFGGQSDSGAFELLLKRWFIKNKKIPDESFRECLDAAVSAAYEADENLETDVSFLNIINGFNAALEK